jgi:hypothetical protein
MGDRAASVVASSGLLLIVGLAMFALYSAQLRDLLRLGAGAAGLILGAGDLASSERSDST